MKRILFVLVAFICASCLFAQKRNVPGIVTDMEGKPLKGIQIKVLDTKIQVKTDKKGEFLLKSVRPDDSVMVYLQRDKGAKFLLGDVGKLQLKLNKEAIKACIPGVNFQYTDSGEEKVSIRGEKSLNLSNEPLVIVDGVETNMTSANATCNIYDVELIEVIKDGLGYGVKGANGVIVIKTKK